MNPKAVGEDKMTLKPCPSCAYCGSVLVRCLKCNADGPLAEEEKEELD